MPDTPCGFSNPENRIATSSIKIALLFHNSFKNLIVGAGTRYGKVKISIIGHNAAWILISKIDKGIIKISHL